MSKAYCPHCGSPNDYGLTPPKFCGQCGKLLAGSIASPNPAAPAQVTVAARPPILRRPSVEIEPEEDEDDTGGGGAVFISPPDKLDIEIQVETPTSRPTVSQLLGTLSPDRVQSVKAPKRSKKARQQALKEWRGKLCELQRHTVGGSE